MSEIVKVDALPERQERKTADSFTADICAAVKAMNVGEILELPIKRLATVVNCKTFSEKLIGIRLALTTVKSRGKCYLKRQA